MVICHLLRSSETMQENLVDSKGLYDTISTVQEGTEYLVQKTVQRFRDFFVSRELRIPRWVEGFANLADALTKYGY